MDKAHADELAKLIDALISADNGNEIQKIIYGESASTEFGHVVVYTNKVGTHSVRTNIPNVDLYFTHIGYYTGDATVLRDKWIVLYGDA